MYIFQKPLINACAALIIKIKSQIRQQSGDTQATWEEIIKTSQISI